MFAKIIVVSVFVAILASLASSMFYMVRDKGQSDRTVKALTLRIALSVSLFVLLLIFFATGLIAPHGIQP